MASDGRQLPKHEIYVFLIGEVSIGSSAGGGAADSSRLLGSGSHGRSRGAVNGVEMGKIACFQTRRVRSLVSDHTLRTRTE